ncbi:hypothetical protein [Paenibacillus sp.]|uniref:hypothetical protein n=1 Tax=Paenibacillus sp. TaxID=58172 RepID=UPI002D5CCE78|nr:hypothetical protein [Paenibacillus sp.]HZG87948.1 hypothetical protein [Paenibacillus sp.]
MIAPKRLLNALFIACSVFGLLLAACGGERSERSERGNDREETADYRFPESVQLQFEPVERIPLVNSGAEAGWVHTQTVPFGSIDGDAVVLDVYKVPESELCGADYERVVLLNHKDAAYRYPNACFSASIEDELREQTGALFKLDYKSYEQGATSAVHGAVELAANGPGRLAYYYFDAAQERWFVFEEWGSPRAVDLDGDGAEELVIHFPGLHMSRPDVTVMRWHAEGISSSGSVKSVLGVPNASYSMVSAMDRDRSIEIEVTAITGLDPETYVTARYGYENGILILQTQ